MNFTIFFYIKNCQKIVLREKVEGEKVHVIWGPEVKQVPATCVRGSAKISQQVTMALYIGSLLHVVPPGYDHSIQLLGDGEKEGDLHGCHPQEQKFVPDRKSESQQSSALLGPRWGHVPFNGTSNGICSPVNFTFEGPDREGAAAHLSWGEELKCSQFTGSSFHHEELGVQ